VTGYTNVAAWSAETALALSLIPDKWAAAGASGVMLALHAVGTFLVWLAQSPRVVEADVDLVNEIVAAVKEALNLDRDE
jgi:hypothetical protein